MLHTKSILVLLVLLMLVACAPTATSTPAPTVAVEATPTPEEAPAACRRTAGPANGPASGARCSNLLHRSGKRYFADEGVSVELVPVSSALEREQLMALAK